MNNRIEAFLRNATIDQVQELINLLEGVNDTKLDELISKLKLVINNTSF